MLRTQIDRMDHPAGARTASRGISPGVTSSCMAVVLPFRVTFTVPISSQVHHASARSPITVRSFGLARPLRGIAPSVQRTACRRDVTRQHLVQCRTRIKNQVLNACAWPASMDQLIGKTARPLAGVHQSNVVRIIRLHCANARTASQGGFRGTEPHITRLADLQHATQRARKVLAQIASATNHTQEM